MSSIALILSESFAEAAFSKGLGENNPTKLWYFRSKSLLDGFREFISENSPFLSPSPELKLCSYWPEMIFQKGLGSLPALIVTAGFEDWLHLRQPKKLFPLSLPPERHKSFFSNDYIFGVGERTAADGNVQETPKVEELEFLHQKLQLAGLNTLAIGFLHATRNPSNETLVANFFRERGYQVWKSHDFGESKNEVGRWWRAGLEAYVSRSLEDSFPVLQVCEEFNIRFDRREALNLDSGYQVLTALKRTYQGSNYRYLLWADLRNFTMIDMKSEQGVAETPWGPIAMETPRLKTLSLKATSLIENEGIQGIRKNFIDIGFDPGPMAFGRGHKPCLLDLLFALDQMVVPKDLEAIVTDNSKDKILQSLAVSMRVLLKNEPHWRDFLLDWVKHQIMSEVVEFAPDQKVLVVGNLASSLNQLFSKYRGPFEFEPNSDAIASQSLLLGTWPAAETKKA